MIVTDKDCLDAWYSALQISYPGYNCRYTPTDFRSHTYIFNKENINPSAYFHWALCIEERRPHVPPSINFFKNPELILKFKEQGQ